MTTRENTSTFQDFFGLFETHAFTRTCKNDSHFLSSDVTFLRQHECTKAVHDLFCAVRHIAVLVCEVKTQQTHYVEFHGLDPFTEQCAKYHFMLVPNFSSSSCTDDCVCL